jgi:energy-coupling factor transporter ATP-binding protein EcfA2
MPPKQRFKDEDKKLINPYEHLPPEFMPVVENPNYEFHKIKLPYRMVITAPSGSGKTSFVVNLLRVFTDTFASIHIVTQDSDEPLYNFIKAKYPAITITEGVNTIPSLDTKTFPKGGSYLVVFDDLVLAKNLDKVCSYYQRCRKLGVSVCFLSQKYHTTPLWIRANCNYNVLLGLNNKRDERLVLSDLASDLDLDQFFRMYRYATDTKASPLFIDVDDRNNKTRFRKGIFEFLDPENFKRDLSYKLFFEQ